MDIVAFLKQQIGMFIITLMYLFCPFVYIALYLDNTKGNMLGYVLLLVGSPIFAFITMLIDNKSAVIWGNICSFIISFTLLYNVHLTNAWHFYYTPVETNQKIAFLLLTILMLIPQLFVIKYVTKYLDKDKVITK